MAHVVTPSVLVSETACPPKPKDRHCHRCNHEAVSNEKIEPRTEGCEREGHNAECQEPGLGRSQCGGIQHRTLGAAGPGIRCSQLRHGTGSPAPPKNPRERVRKRPTRVRTHKHPSLAREKTGR